MGSISAAVLLMFSLTVAASGQAHTMTGVDDAWHLANSLVFRLFAGTALVASLVSCLRLLVHDPFGSEPNDPLQNARWNHRRTTGRWAAVFGILAVVGTAITFSLALAAVGFDTKTTSNFPDSHWGLLVGLYVCLAVQLVALVLVRTLPPN